MIKNTIQMLGRIFRPKKEPEIYIDSNIEWMGDHVCLNRKHYPEMMHDHRTGILTEEEKNKMTISIKAIKEGTFEVNGVIMYADTPLEAQRKYLRQKK